MAVPTETGSTHMTLMFWIAGGLAAWFMLSIIVAAVLGPVIRHRDHEPQPLLVGRGRGRRLVDSDSRVLVGAQRHHHAV